MNPIFTRTKKLLHMLATVSIVSMMLIAAQAAMRAKMHSARPTGVHQRCGRTPNGTR